MSYKIKKAAFVMNEFTEMLKSMELNIACAVYDEDPKSGEEYVYVTYENGYVKTICVSCDSLLGIAKDVIDKIN